MHHLGAHENAPPLEVKKLSSVNKTGELLHGEYSDDGQKTGTGPTI